MAQNIFLRSRLTNGLVRAMIGGGIMVLSLIPSEAAGQVPFDRAKVQIQQKDYHQPKSVIFASVISTLQDFGFEIDSGDVSSGLIKAHTASESRTSFWDALDGTSSSGTIAATVFVDEFSRDSTHVRISLFSKKLGSGQYGQSSQRDKAVSDASVYQRIFARIDETVIARNAQSGSAGTSTPYQASKMDDITPIASLGEPVSIAVPDAVLSLRNARINLEQDGFSVIQYDEKIGTLVTAANQKRLKSSEADCGKVFGIPYLSDKRASTSVQVFLTVSIKMLTARIAVDGIYRAGHGNHDQALRCRSRGVFESELLRRLSTGLR